MFKQSLLGLMILGLIGCAGQGENLKANALARDCFNASSVRGFDPVDNTTVRLRVGRGEVFELDLLSYCPDVDWSQRIGLRNRSGSSLICTSDAMGVEIVLLDRLAPMGPDSCRVRSIRKLDPQEIEAERVTGSLRRGSGGTTERQSGPGT